jgi:hypothetical protein
MRFQSMIGNTALVLEAEMFGQPSLRAKWKKKYGARPEDINGLAVEEHVARLRTSCCRWLRSLTGSRARASRRWTRWGWDAGLDHPGGVAAARAGYAGNPKPQSILFYPAHITRSLPKSPGMRANIARPTG